MTAEIIFIHNNEMVVSVRMEVDSFYYKILSDLTDEEFEKWIPNFNAYENMSFSNADFIENVWNSCVMYGYISSDYDVTGKFIDKMKFITKFT